MVESNHTHLETGGIMEPGTAVLIAIIGTAVFILGMFFLLKKFKKDNEGKYPPATEGKFFEIRKSEK